MNDSAVWRMAHETDVFPYYYDRTDLPFPRASGFIQELWDSLARTHRKSIVIDSCADESTDVNELGSIGNACRSLMEDGSVVTMMEGAFIGKPSQFYHHSLPIFTTQVRFYEVVDVTTDNAIDWHRDRPILLQIRPCETCKLAQSQSSKLYGATMLILLKYYDNFGRVFCGIPREYCPSNVLFHNSFNIEYQFLFITAHFSDFTAMQQMLRAGTKIFLQAYEGEWEDIELDVIISEKQRKKNAYATSTGRVDLLDEDDVCDDERYIAGLYPMEVIEAINQNKIASSESLIIPMTVAQAKAMPEFFFPTPSFFLLSKNLRDTRILIKEIDFLMAGPFNIETLPIWTFHASNAADRSSREQTSPMLMHAPISLTKISKFLYFTVMFYGICLLAIMAEIITSRTRKTTNLRTNVIPREHDNK